MRFIQVRAGNWRSSDKHYWSGCLYIYMDVSENSGTPKSSILIGFSIINHPFWGTSILETPIYSIYKKMRQIYRQTYKDDTKSPNGNQFNSLILKSLPTRGRREIKIWAFQVAGDISRRICHISLEGPLRSRAAVQSESMGKVGCVVFFGFSKKNVVSLPEGFFQHAVCNVK